MWTRTHNLRLVALIELGLVTLGSYQRAELNHWRCDRIPLTGRVVVRDQLVELFFDNVWRHPASKPAEGAFCIFRPAT